MGAKVGLTVLVWAALLGGADTLHAQERPFVLDTLRVEAASRLPGGPAGRTRSAQVLTAEELSELPLRTVGDALRWAVGVDLNARSAAQADLSLRGSSFEQVLVLVDGVRMSDPQTGHFDLDLTVPLDQVERIEILRGPASAVYGADAVGGVVNVVTRRGGGALTGRLEGGSWESARASLSAGGAAGPVDGSLSGEWSRSDGHRDGTDHRTLLVHGGGGVVLAGGRLGLQAGYGRRDFGAKGFYAPFDSYEETRTATAAVGWSGPLAGLTVEPRATVRRHDDDFVLEREDPDFFRNVHRSEQVGGELVVRDRVTEGLAWVAGGEVVRESVESTVLGDRTEERGGAFLEVAGGREDLAASVGLRVDGYENFGTTWSPSLSASWDPVPRVRLRAAWGRSFRPPTWTERYYEDPANVGRPDLRPERSWTVEAGVDVALPAGALLRGTAFRRESRDLIDWARPAAAADDPDPPRWRTRNVESAVFDGLELSLRGLEVGGTTLSGSLTLLEIDAAEAVGFVSKSALRPLTRRATVGLGRSFLDGRLRTAAQLLHARREGGDDWTLLDLRTSVEAVGGRVYLDLTNLTRTSYLDVTMNRAPGRSVRVGYRIGGG